MKKPVILSLIAVYILAIVIVGIMGGAFKIYNPTVYVDKIVCENANSTGATNDERSELGDYYIKKEVKINEPISIEIKCKVEPADATDTRVNISKYDENDTTFTLEEINEKEGSAILKCVGLNDTTTIYLVAKSCDNAKKEIIIRIDILIK